MYTPPPVLPFPPYTRPDPTLLDTIADVMLLGGGLGIAVFVVAYALLFKWHETGAGRSVLAFTTSLLLVLVLVLVGKVPGGDYPGRELVRLAAYGSCLLTSWGLVVVLARSWLRGGPVLDLRERDSARRTGTTDTITDD